jgi:hypothetical protein
VNLISLDGFEGEEIYIESASINVVSTEPIDQSLIVESKHAGLEWTKTTIKGKLDGIYVSLVSFTLTGKSSTSLGPVEEGEVIPLLTFRGIEEKSEFRLADNDADRLIEVSGDNEITVKQMITASSGKNIYAGNIRPPYKRKYYSSEKSLGPNDVLRFESDEERYPSEFSNKPTSLMLENSIFHYLSINDFNGINRENDSSRSKIQKPPGIKSLNVSLEKNVLIRTNTYRIGLKVNPNPYALVKAYMKIENTPEVKSI